MNSSSTFDVNMGIMQLIMSVSVGPRQWWLYFTSLGILLSGV